MRARREAGTNAGTCNVGTGHRSDPRRTLWGMAEWGCWLLLSRGVAGRSRAFQVQRRGEACV
eukprot:5397199-Lingulodinium_polyedra.AAC.1